MKPIIACWRQRYDEWSYTRHWRRATDEVRKVRRMSDNDLAALILTASQDLRVELARSEQRVREAWRSPAKWSFLVSLGSLSVAAVALLRTL